MPFRGAFAALAFGASVFAMPSLAGEVAGEAPAPEAPKIETVAPPLPVAEVSPLPPAPRKLAPPADMAADGGKYDIFLSPRMIIPPKEPVAAGTRRTLAAGDTLFKAPLGWLFHAAVDAPVTAEIAGIKVSIQPGEVLRRAVSFKGGDLARFDKGTPVYCQKAKMNDAQNALSLLTLGLTDLATKVSKETQFCLLDTDNDSRFDHAFLEGLKLPEDRKTIAIDPVGYVARTAVDDEGAFDEGDYIQVRMAPNAGLFGRSLLTEVYLDNTAQGISGIYWYMWPSMAKLYTNTSQKVPGKNYPQTMSFANAFIKVHGYDKTAKTMEIEYLRDFGMTPLTLYFYSYY